MTTMMMFPISSSTRTPGTDKNIAANPIRMMMSISESSWSNLPPAWICFDLQLVDLLLDEEEAAGRHDEGPVARRALLYRGRGDRELGAGDEVGHQVLDARLLLQVHVHPHPHRGREAECRHSARMRVADVAGERCDQRRQNATMLVTGH
ncbi:hypothetical protein ABZ438_10390 [Streptomyces sp. NPDC005786]|uniref:hypothetical protein n=1 Tax=Streptomyces sp. NPDC005786 TaxID=3154891 RepID=UPI0033F16900